MPAWLTTLTVAFVTALRFVGLPAFVALVSFSLLWKRSQGTWYPLWKLGTALLTLLVLATAVFTLTWRSALGAP